MEGVLFEEGEVGTHFYEEGWGIVGLPAIKLDVIVSFNV